MENKPTNQIKLWLTAVRPFAYTASTLPVVLGLVLAVNDGHSVRWICFVLSLLGVLCFHTAANLLNDGYDYSRGLDVQINPMSGAVVRGWLSEAQVKKGAAVCVAVGVACGLLLVYAAGWVVLLLGLAGSVLVLGYTGPKFCLKYAGLGDAAIFLAFGFLPVFGTWWVQARTFSWLPFLWTFPAVLHTVGILHSNNWRDRDSDASKNCLTIAGLLGENLSKVYYRILVLAPFLLVTVFALAGRYGKLFSNVPLTVLAVWLSLPLAWQLVKVDRKAAAFPALDGLTARLQLVFGFLLVTGFLAGRLLN